MFSGSATRTSTCTVLSLVIKSFRSNDIPKKSCIFCKNIESIGLDDKSYIIHNEGLRRYFLHLFILNADMSTIIAFSGIHSETVILDCTQFHGCLCKANSCIFKCSPKVFYSLKPTPPHRNSKGTHYYIFIRVIIIIYIVKLRKGLRGQVMVWSWKSGWFTLCQISILWPITFCL